MTSERADLAARQAALVAALVAGGPPPPGFDTVRLDATRRALLRKRAGLAAGAWPLLAASLGAQWQSAFARQHDGHESGGALRDGWDLARALRDGGGLAPAAAEELAAYEAEWRYDGRSAPRRRRFGRVRLALAERVRRS